MADMVGGWDQGLWALVPTIAVSLLFWFVMRAILRADRSERAAQAKYEAQFDAALLASSETESVDGPASRRSGTTPPSSR